MAQKVVWFEIMGRNLGAMKEFYHEVLGLETRPMGEMPGYEEIQVEEGSLGGGLGVMEVEHPPYATVYFAVPEVTETLEKAEANGGQRVLEKTALPGGNGYFGIFLDPDGIVIGVFSEK